MERVSSFRFLGTHIIEDLTWTHSTTTFERKAQKRLYFLRILKRAKFPRQVLTNLHRGAIECILIGHITIWQGTHKALDRKAWQKLPRTLSPPHYPPSATPKRGLVESPPHIVKDSTHACHRLFTLLPSGRRYRSLCCRTTRLWDSISPQAVRLVNSNSASWHQQK